MIREDSYRKEEEKLGEKKGKQKEKRERQAMK